MQQSKSQGVALPNRDKRAFSFGNPTCELPSAGLQSIKLPHLYNLSSSQSTASNGPNMQLAYRSKPSKRAAALEYLHVTSSKLPRPLTFIYQPKPNRTRAGNDANPMFSAPYHQLFMASLQAGFESPVFTLFPVNSNGLNTTPQHAVHWHAALDFLGKQYMSDEHVHYDSEQGARMNVAVKAWARYNQLSFRDMWMRLFETNDEELVSRHC